uniref:DNA polymerase delta subunit 2 n=2 Tax=Ciona intestinalis TaxID=7719 RepID=F7BF26_CIOIN
METDETIHTRQSCERENLSKRFTVINEPYERQYAHIYFVRSEIMRPKVIQAAQRKWGDGVKINKLSEIEEGEKCCIVGTLFKQMELQPSILKEISEEVHVQIQPERKRFISDDDKLILEDTMQRISLTGNISAGDCFTGTVVALLGKETKSGHFNVEDFTYAGLPSQIPAPDLVGNDNYVLFVSGLGIGGKKEKTLQIQMLIDYILGMLGGSEDHEVSSKIVHVIVAGNSLAGETLDKEAQTKARYLTYKSEASTVQAISDLDFFLSQLVPFVSVDLMGGEFDPTNHVLPQKPMHPCMFPSSRRFYDNTFHTVSNPYECKINGVYILGTSGQNLDNLKSYSNVDDDIKLLSSMIECQHVAPTAPDTLGCFPFYKSDPFIIEQCPHVFFSGNQSKYFSSVKKGAEGQKVLLLAVPAFTQTCSAVLVNLKDLTAEEINFEADWSQSNSSVG